MRSARLDQLDRVPWLGGLTWLPVRMELGVRAFGVAGFTADAGAVVVEPHVETRDGRGHQELYVVMAGRAVFTVSGETVDAPAGTLVAVEPDEPREACAAEDGTIVLAFGDEPTFAASGFEWQMRAKPFFESDPQRARAILQDGLAEIPGSAAIPYAFAQLEAAQGNLADARLSLEEAVRREPRLREEAERDPLLDGLRGAGPGTP
jgi:quercetin dioxygenase-like cupin family protein